jgi:hypothetical protein
MKAHKIIAGFFVILSSILGTIPLPAAPVKTPAAFPGSWESANRAVVKSTPTSLTVSGGYVATKEQFGDCEFVFQAKALTVSGTDAPVQIWGGVRVKDVENRYVVGVRGGAEPELSFARYAADGRSKFLGWVELDPAPRIGETFTVRVAAGGNRFHVYLNDEKLPRINIEDKDALWTEGGVALGGGWLPVEFSSPAVSALKLAEFNAVGDKVWSPPSADFDKASRRKEQRAAYQPVKVDKLPPLRGAVSLDGDWLFMPDQDNKNHEKSGAAEVDDSTWHLLRVPAFWSMTVGWLHGEFGMAGLKEAQAARGPSDKLIADEYKWRDALTFDWRRTRGGWYRHYVELPADLQGRELELVFDAVAKVSEVWVNGEKVANNAGMFRQIRADVTRQLKPGKNLIAVRVIGNPGRDSVDAKQIAGVAVSVEVTNDMLNSLPHGMADNNSGGIWQPVRLEASPPLRVSDVFIRPALDGFDADIELTNNTAAERAVSIAYTVNDALDQSVLDQGAAPLTVKVPANGTASVPLKTAKKLQPKLWSPAAPNLYFLNLTVSDGRSVLDRQETRFGFRTFAAGDGKLLLNGRPFWIRGGNHFPVTIRPNDAALAHKFTQLAREGNVNVTRSHAIPFTEPWFAATDEIGMGVSFEGTWPWLMLLDNAIPDEWLLAVWKDEFASLIRRHRNHPSLLFWTVNNEMKFHHAKQNPDRQKTVAGQPKPTADEIMTKKWAILDDMLKTMRALDPTRPIVADSGYIRKESDKHSKEIREQNKFDDGDIDDLHGYFGWYNESFFHFYNGEYGKRYATPGRPLISQEMSTGYIRGDDWPTRHYVFGFNRGKDAEGREVWLPRYVPQALVGNYALEQHDPLIFSTRHAFMTKELAEVIRRADRDDANGLLHFAYLTWFTDSWLADSVRPKLTYFELKTALQPVLVSAELYGRHWYAGEKITRRVAIANDADDGKDLPAGELKWEFRAADRVLAQGKINTPPVKFYTNEWLDVEFATPPALPLPRINAKLTLTLAAGGTVISENHYDIVLATRAWAAADTDAQLYDPQGKAKAATAGLSLSTVNSPSQFNPGKPLLVGDTAALLKAADGEKKFKEFLEQGGNALLLNAGKDALALFPEQLKSYRTTGNQGEIATPLAPDSPVFDGIEPLDLAWFEPDERKVPQVCTGTYEVNRAAVGAQPLALQSRIHVDMEKKVKVNGKEIPTFKYFEDAGAPLVELRIGKGKVIISEIALEAADRDPVAGRLLANILRYLK